MSKFCANVIKLAISLDSFSKQCYKVILLNSSDPLSSKILTYRCTYIFKCSYYSSYRLTLKSLDWIILYKSLNDYQAQFCGSVKQTLQHGLNGCAGLSLLLMMLPTLSKIFTIRFRHYSTLVLQFHTFMSCFFHS